MGSGKRQGLPIWVFSAATVTVVVAGFVGAGVAVGARVYNQQLDAAHSQLQRRADTSAYRLAGVLSTTAASTAKYVADLGFADALDDPASCRESVSRWSTLIARNTMTLFGPAGRIVCSSSTQPEISAAERAAIARVVADGTPTTRIIDGARTIEMIMPIGTDGHEIAGSLVLTMPVTEHLRQFASGIVGSAATEDGTEVTVTNAAGEILWPAEGVAARGAAGRFATKTGGEWPDLDGASRLWESARVGKSGIRLFLGTRRSDLVDSARDVVQGLVPVALLALGAIVVITLLLARTVTRPIRRFISAVNRSGAHLQADRAPTEGPRELRRLAEVYKAMIDERSQYEHQLEHQALHDELTGLANRALLVDRLDVALARSRRESRQVAVLFCDLDRFKVVNDSLGHESGDRILVAASRRLASAVRQSDTVARFGGDEFVVLCDQFDDGDDAELLAHRLRASLATPVDDHDLAIDLDVSIGVAVSHLHSTAEEILRDADTAMYAVKSRGGGGIEIFRPELHDRARERWEIERDLRRALERAELEVWYQSQVDTESGDVVGVEALLRWQHPTRGWLPPLSFLVVAEEAGLMQALGSFVLDAACRQAAAWRREGFDVPVSVNVSPRQLGVDLEHTVTATLADTGLPPDRLCLEFTEDALIDTSGENGAVLARLRAQGVKIALDDFGVGYSSLSVLRSLPVDVLKIDRSLLQDLGDSGSVAIMTAVVGLANAFGLLAIAEGVERDDQAAALREMGCRIAQGFLYARPEPPDRVVKRVDPRIARTRTSLEPV